jgi:hypothetical protein
MYFRAGWVAGMIIYRKHLERCLKACTYSIYQITTNLNVTLDAGCMW